MDGLGWLVEKRARLLMAYPSFTLRFIRLELTGAQGWVWYNAAVEHEQMSFGPANKRTTDGYIRQETQRLMAMVKIKKR